MPVEQVRVPRAGESITEGTLNRWLKPDGAFVNVDDPLFELGTDKATQEVAAQVAGVLKILVKEGETVAVESVVASIDTDAKAPADKPKAEKPLAASRPAAPESPREGREAAKRQLSLSPARPRRGCSPSPASARPRSPAPAPAAASRRATCWPTRQGTGNRRHRRRPTGLRRLLSPVPCLLPSGSRASR